ncbi:hypothetical protein QF042_000168 [Pedobacter sp. W3I1]|nr:hypothetical protein [Pedobacter sp. W3I1]
MHIVGLAKDQTGKEYYIVKHSREQATIAAFLLGFNRKGREVFAKPNSRHPEFISGSILARKMLTT